MARQARINIENAFYHVMIRGNNGQNIFFCNEDRYQIYKLLQEGTLRFRFHIHGFCLMSNHIHLALQVSDVSISKIMQNICFRYAKWFNKRNNQIGHVFQGRFKSKLIDSDDYLVKLIQYIHLNPVKAFLVKKPEEYFWSSHRAYINKGFLPWLTTDFILRFFGKDRFTAITNFRSHVENSDLLICSDPDMNFEAAITFKNPVADNKIFNSSNLPNNHLNIDDVIKHTCHYYDIEEIELHSPRRITKNSEIRAMIAWLVIDLKIGTATQVAKHFKRDATGIIRALHRIDSESEDRLKVQEIKKLLLKSINQA